VFKKKNPHYLSPACLHVSLTDGSTVDVFASGFVLPHDRPPGVYGISVAADPLLLISHLLRTFCRFERTEFL